MENKIKNEYTDHTAFNEFVQNNPNWKYTYSVSIEDDATFQRVKCTHIKKDNKVQIYNGCIDVRTGDIYTNCSKKFILQKHCVAFFVQPIHICVKTLWHASIIGPLVYEIYKAAITPPNGERYERRWKQIPANMLKSTLEIIRKPLYGIALIVVYLFGMLSVVFGQSNILYHTRALAGKLERRALHIQTQTDIRNLDNQRAVCEIRRFPYTTLLHPAILHPCFHPIANIAKDLHTGEVFKTEGGGKKTVLGRLESMGKWGTVEE